MEREGNEDVLKEGVKPRKFRSKGSMISPNEIFGYSSSAMFFVFALVIYLNILLPGQFQEYRTILVAILVLYGILRFLITRSKALARQRYKKIEMHREELKNKQIDS